MYQEAVPVNSQPIPTPLPVPTVPAYVGPVEPLPVTVPKPAWVHTQNKILIK